MRRGVPVLVLMLLVAACSTGAAEESTTTAAPVPTTVATTTTTVETTTTTTTLTTTTTTTAAPTTSSTAGAIPYPDNTGTDWFRIATELTAFAGWLFENPDADLVAEISVPGSSHYQGFHEQIQRYEQTAIRDLPGGRQEVLFAALAAGEPENGVVLLRVATRYEGATTVDADGEVVAEDPPREDRVNTWELRGSPEEGWRLAISTNVGPYNGGAS